MINKDNKYSGNKDNIHQGNTRNNENIDKRLKIRTSDNNINLHSSIRIRM